MSSELKQEIADIMKYLANYGTIISFPFCLFQYFQSDKYFWFWL